MRKLKHVGKAPVRFNFALSLRHARGLPESVTMVSVCWERSGKAVTTPAVSVEASGSERLANLSDCQLQLQATLFRSGKRFDPKSTVVRLLACNPDGGSALIAEADLDLASAAAPDAPQPDVRILVLRPAGRSSSEGREMLLQLTVSAIPEGGVAADEENASHSSSRPTVSGADDSQALPASPPKGDLVGQTPPDSSMLTREAIRALEEQQRAKSRPPPKARPAVAHAQGLATEPA